MILVQAVAAGVGAAAREVAAVPRVDPAEIRIEGVSSRRTGRSAIRWPVILKSTIMLVEKELETNFFSSIPIRAKLPDFARSPWHRPGR